VTSVPAKALLGHKQTKAFIYFLFIISKAIKYKKSGCDSKNQKNLPSNTVITALYFSLVQPYYELL